MGHDIRAGLGIGTPIAGLFQVVDEKKHVPTYDTYTGLPNGSELQMRNGWMVGGKFVSYRGEDGNLRAHLEEEYGLYLMGDTSQGFVGHRLVKEFHRAYSTYAIHIPQLFLDSIPEAVAAVRANLDILMGDKGLAYDLPIMLCMYVESSS